MVAKFIVAGTIKDYQNNFNLLKRETEKGNAVLLACILTDSKFTCIDGMPCYSDYKQMLSYNADYIICLDNDVKQWHDLLKSINIGKKCVPVRVFAIPNFDFKKYERLLNDTPSIVARHCWGGILFHYLGLEFNSPFVNLFLSDRDFNKLASNFAFYMNQELVYLEDGWEVNLKRNYPKAKLGDLVIHFNHYLNFDEAKITWDKRKERLNWNNLFFETTTESAEVAREFDAINVARKLCFCNEDISSSDVIDFSMFDYKKGQLGMFVNGTANGVIPYFDVLDLLNGVKSDLRIGWEQSVFFAYKDFVLPPLNDPYNAFVYYCDMVPNTHYIIEIEGATLEGSENTQEYSLGIRYVDKAVYVLNKTLKTGNAVVDFYNKEINCKMVVKIYSGIIGSCKNILLKIKSIKMKID